MPPELGVKYTVYFWFNYVLLDNTELNVAWL